MLGRSMETDSKDTALPRAYATKRDLAQLNRLLSALIGLPCWHIGFYNGQAFQLQIGDKVEAEPDDPLSADVLRDLLLGSWGVSFWDVDVIGYRPGNGGDISETFPVRSRAEIDASLFECAVVDMTAYWPTLALSIVFESGVGLYALPDEGGRNFWDILMPDKTMIKVVQPRTWIRKSVHGDVADGAGSPTGDGNQAIRRSATEAGLNEAGAFALGAAVVARLEADTDAEPRAD
jgi:hypothetical protein